MVTLQVDYQLEGRRHAILVQSILANDWRRRTALKDID
jgi:hypothetical protein